jgi:hypothetical protein
MAILGPSWFVCGYIAAGAAVVGFGGGWSVNGWRLGSDLTECKAESARKDTLIDEQNRAVGVLKAASDIGRTAAQDAAKRASEAQAKAQASDDARRAAIKANTGPQTCSAAIAAIRARP